MSEQKKIKMKKALITGVMGQDGSYLSKLLLEKGYKVYSAIRRNGSGNEWRHKYLDIQNDVEIAGKYLDFNIEWQGKNENTIGIDRNTGKTIVKVNPKFYRPCEVDLLIGNPEKAEKVLGWKPKVQVEELAKMMVESDYNLLKK